MKPYSRPWDYHRRRTREVHIGDVGVGGSHPLRIQSMTTPATHDVEATVEQIRRLVEAGCEIVRVTVPSTRDAEALPEIRRRLASARIRVPLVADIHFSPAAAMMAVEHVEKVRINPGNYADTKRFKVWEYTDAEYQAELERIEQRFKPLVLRAKERGVSLRIGTNHGSLSDRILNRYGDTPLGMVESALEFVRICETYGHRELILSMKSSNPMVMIRAYRLLAQRMAAEGMDYPFHLGVTEAGDGEDGRIKSAIGIGTLLEEGIGDTIRVSLTEDPVAEIPVARDLAEKYNAWIREGSRLDSAGRTSPATISELVGSPADPPPGASGAYARRESSSLRIGNLQVGDQAPVWVECVLRASLSDSAAMDFELSSLSGTPAAPEARAEIVEVDRADSQPIMEVEALSRSLRGRRGAPALSLRWKLPSRKRTEEVDLGRVAACCDRLTLLVDSSASAAEQLPEAFLKLADESGCALHLTAPVTGSGQEAALLLAELAKRIRSTTGSFPVLSLEVSAGVSPVSPYRTLAATLKRLEVPAPILLRADVESRRESPLLFPPVYLGALLCDGIGDGVRIEQFGSPADSLRLAFNILQGTRLRLFKTEFISCPSCGRTQFDLEETTRRIKARTAHLKGVKIAIMGCIVNGPGEMADADFGYVGWGPGKVSLFVGKNLVEKDIPYAEADERLVGLIKEHGRWIEPPVSQTSAPLPAGRGRD